MAEPLLQCRELTISRADRALVRNLTLTIEPGMRVGVLGANGVGKSTLLATLAGLADLGTVTHDALHLAGRPYSHWSHRQAALRRSWLGQQPSWGLGLSVFETVLMSRYPHYSILQGPSDADRQQTRDALAQLHLLPLAARDVNELSGGERQRVALARLLAQGSPLMFLDEPFTHLDVVFQLQAEALFRHLSQGANSLMFSLHEVNSAARACTHALLLWPADRYPGQNWCWGTIPSVLTPESLQRTHDCEFAAIPWEGGLVFEPKSGSTVART